MTTVYARGTTYPWFRGTREIYSLAVRLQFPLPRSLGFSLRLLRRGAYCALPTIPLAASLSPTPAGSLGLLSLSHKSRLAMFYALPV